jgi:hypothetical protein
MRVNSALLVITFSILELTRTMFANYSLPIEMQKDGNAFAEMLTEESRLIYERHSKRIPASVLLRLREDRRKRISIRRSYFQRDP